MGRKYGEENKPKYDSRKKYLEFVLIIDNYKKS